MTTPSRDAELPAEPRVVTAAPFRVTDSPWFWGTAFSAMALVGLGLIAPKEDIRQRQIERRFLGRQEAHVERTRRAAGLDPVDLAAEAIDRDEAAPGRIVPLWTLAIAAAAGTILCGVMLARERARHREAAPPAPPSPAGPPPEPVPPAAPLRSESTAAVAAAAPAALVLHVGGLKTGSSALQRDLTWAPHLPPGDGATVPHEYMALVAGQLLRGGALADFAAQFAALYGFSAPLGPLLEQPPEALAATVAALDRVRREGTAPVLSFEGWLSEPRDLVHRFTSALGMPIRVVAFVRDPVSTLDSWYWERFQEIERPLQEWVEAQWLQVAAWDELLGRWAGAPNVERVDVCLAGDDATAAFCDLLRCVPPPRGGLHNRSLPGVLARFLERRGPLSTNLSEVKFAWWRWVEATGDDTAPLGRTPAVLDESLAARVVAASREDSLRLLDRCTPAVRARIESDPRWWSADTEIRSRRDDPATADPLAEADLLLDLSLRAIVQADAAWRRAATRLRHAGGGDAGPASPGR